MVDSSNNKMEELWRDIPGFEGRYQASNYGRIRSLDYTMRYKNSDILAYRKGKVLSAKTDKYGYFEVTLSVNKRRYCRKVHQLVGLTFIPNPNNYPVINHINENKKDNTVWVNSDGSINLDKTNLEWCTLRYNTQEYHKRRTLIYQYDLDGNLIKIWNSGLEAAKSINGFISGVHHCCSKNVKTYKGYIWTFTPITSEELTRRKSNDHSPKIEQLDLLGNVLNQFNSMQEAAKATGSNVSSISFACSGKNKTANGYKWRKVV